MRHRTRSKSLAAPMELGRLYFRNYGGAHGEPWVLTNTYDTYSQWIAYPYTRVEHCYDVVHSGPPYLEGGPFDCWTADTNIALPSGFCTAYEPASAAVAWRKYVGGHIILRNATIDQKFSDITGYKYPGSPDNFPNGAHTWGDGSSYGATGWKRFRPAQPTADLGVFLGEIRDVPRMLQSTARGFSDLFKARFGRNPRGKMRKAADHWLNTQFGWRPFLNDLRKFYITHRKLNRLVEQIRRDNGNWVKRAGSVKRVMNEDVLYEIQHSVIDSCPVVPQLHPVHYTSGKAAVETGSLVEAQNVWFEARFRYWIPDVESDKWESKAKISLFGANLNPALIWELTPWSWLVDWATNMGDVISNLTDNLAENLAAKYAYVMATTERSIRINVRINYISGAANASQVFTLKRKQRTEANPFGFGLTYDGLSARQWSILTALGITRMH